MRSVEVLMSEDNAADRFWLEYVLKSLKLNCSFSSVADGESAVDFLLKRGKYAEAATPNLIFQREFGIQDSNYLLKPVSQESLLASSCCKDHLDPAAKL